MTHHGQQDEEALPYIVQPVRKDNVLPTDLEQSRQDVKKVWAFSRRRGTVTRG